MLAPLDRAHPEGQFAREGQHLGDPDILDPGQFDHLESERIANAINGRLVLELARFERGRITQIEAFTSELPYGMAPIQRR